MSYIGTVPNTLAADPASNIAEQIHDKFNQKSTEYGTKLKGYALGLFKLFLLIGIVVFGVQAALGRAEIADVIKEFLIMMVFAAFCFVAIQYYQEWTRETAYRLHSNLQKQGANTVKVYNFE